jgi:8-oxo-dGTP diphosphatase
LNFYLGTVRRLDQVVFVFSCHKYAGNLHPNREGELRWFSSEGIPYSEMWEDDRIWLPLLLEGKSFVGDFYFTDDYKQLMGQSLTLVLP